MNLLSAMHEILRKDHIGFSNFVESLILIRESLQRRAAKDPKHTQVYFMLMRLKGHKPPLILNGHESTTSKKMTLNYTPLKI